MREKASQLYSQFKSLFTIAGSGKETSTGQPNFAFDPQTMQVIGGEGGGGGGGGTELIARPACLAPLNQ